MLLSAGKITEDELAAMPDELRTETEVLRKQLAIFKARFNAQLKRSDPHAPILPKTDPQYNPNAPKIQRRKYRTLNTFIRAMLLQNLKAE
jgi:hypothetical protein